MIIKYLILLYFFQNIHSQDMINNDRMVFLRYQYKSCKEHIYLSIYLNKMDILWQINKLESDENSLGYQLTIRVQL